MLFKSTVVALVFMMQNGCFCRTVDRALEMKDRQNDMSVRFLFWSNEQSGGQWAFDWATWSYHFVTERPAPFTLRFDSSVDTYFEELISNTDKFKTGAKTKVIIHGWTENGEADWIKRMAEAYFDSDPDLNVISVGWEELAQGPDYPPAAENTQAVGQHVGNFINYMVSHSQTSFSLNDFHIVGFSLGAQVAGKAGETLNGQLPRITGLDPAGELFEKFIVEKGQRLDSSDAVFVDVIHTSANSHPQIGNSDELGDMDFWPNGGSTPMPGTEWSLHPGGYSHFRATEYFVESIQNPSGFRARKANNYAEFQTSGGCTAPEQMMGEAASPDGPNGNYYVDTNANAPYAKGQTCFA